MSEPLPTIRLLAVELGDLSGAELPPDSLQAAVEALSARLRESLGEPVS